jgi:hypothetical protein
MNSLAKLGELVGDTERQRQLWPDNREVDLELGREVHQLLNLIASDGNQIRDLANARITRCAVQLLEHLTLPQLPAQCVFSSPAADDQYFHFSPLKK